MEIQKRSWYNKKLLELSKRFAKERDGYICQKTGKEVKGSNAHGSHVIPISAGQHLRYDIDNIKCLSYHAHINWWHKNPTESGEWFKAKFPERMEYLEKMRTCSKMISTISLHELYIKARSAKTWEEYKNLYDEIIKPELED